MAPMKVLRDTLEPDRNAVVRDVYNIPWERLNDDSPAGWYSRTLGWRSWNSLQERGPLTLLGNEKPNRGASSNESVLEEAQRIITGDRRDSYGGAAKSFDTIAALWSGVLGVEVTGYQVALCMIQLKVARYMNGQQRDSAVDIAGYAGLLDELWRAP